MDGPSNRADHFVEIVPFVPDYRRATAEQVFFLQGLMGKASKNQFLQHSINISHSLYTNHCSLGVPKITLRFNDSLEGFTKFRKAIVLTVLAYYSNRIHIKISKVKRHMEKGPGETIYSWPLPVECCR